MRKKRLRLGDIYEIPLPNGKNAYGRLYREYTLAIYKKRCTSIEELPNTEDYDFFVGVYKDLLQDGEWKIVGNRKFITEEDAWAPPQCVVDAITKTGSLYYKGEIKPCTYEECKDLEVVAAWDRHHIIDRLMGNADWMKFLDKPINPEK
ncbi:Imm26 family immunity protein [Acetivibrio ethanolgignens]|uniref:Uncharacterized protein n=1 Tax=Acetivibrio ethanolgignens TaxID=290052 RepID=A0A0V8QIB6_9FIRM|nr:Imm26 family immunity protein [Acetivibrio ethanolgignens]KSV60222.1 hypothetical protein ASU35_17310 [Acetivibrio ethanolgignens]